MGERDKVGADASGQIEDMGTCGEKRGVVCCHTFVGRHLKALAIKEHLGSVFKLRGGFLAEGPLSKRPTSRFVGSFFSDGGNCGRLWLFVFRKI